MKKIIMGAVILIAILVTLVACNNNTVTSSIETPYEAELLLPGNTLVIGTCTEILRFSDGWVKVKINNRWYACSEWRVTLIEGVIK